MLTIKVPAKEFYNEKTNEFFRNDDLVLELEHSLRSVSLWESKWNVPFLSYTTMTTEQSLDYIRCMTLNGNFDKSVYMSIPISTFEEINKYIDAPMTATWFNDRGAKTKRSREVITSEVIYYWMTVLNIPFECDQWHLNRLLTLIRVCNIKNSKPKKMSKRDTYAQYQELNAQRRKALNSKG